jgi:hypothetical protein
MPGRRVLPLTSMRLLIALGVGAALSLALAVLGWRRHLRHPLLVTSTSAVLCLGLVLGGVGAGVNKHFGLFHRWRDLFGLHSRDLVTAHNPAQVAKALAALSQGAIRTHGQLLSLRIPSPVSHFRADGALVYLPPQYAAPTYQRKGFPVIEAIPGSPGRPSDYIDGIQADVQLDQAIAAHKIPPAIVVFPASNRSFFRSLECADTADGYRDETYLTTDVHDWVTRTLKTDHARWTVMGYSTGGYCALDLSFHHPDLFARAISLDGYTHALRDHYARGIWAKGAAGAQARLEHSPDWWMLHHAPEPVDTYVAAGTLDAGAAASALSFWHAIATSGWARPANRLVTEQDGHHTFPAWSKAFLPALEWALNVSAPTSSPSSSAQAQLTAALARGCRPRPQLLPGPVARSSCAKHARAALPSR